MLLDSLEDQIALLDQQGLICYVNAAWKRFGEENGAPPNLNWIGINYLQVCTTSANRGDALADAAYQGIYKVISGQAENFYIEYPCHSPSQQRWFMMRIVPLTGSTGGPLWVISHINITQRKIAEEHLAQITLQDELTNLANRRFLDRFLHNEWQRNMRSQTPISLLMIDLDHFKDYNDTHGHPAGDQCLIKVGQALKGFSRRPTDLSARYGGEEFTLVLGETDLSVAMKEAEALREAICKLQLGSTGNLCISASIGVACTVPQQGQDENKLLRAADLALYQAKNRGRNQCVASQC